MIFGIINISRTNEIAMQKCSSSRRGRNSSSVEQFDGIPDSVCLIADTSRTVCYDIAIPGKLRKKALEDVLYAELSARLPVNPAEVFWFYRKTAPGTFRVCAVHHEEIERVLQSAEQHQLKFDTFIPDALIDSPFDAGSAVAATPIPGNFKPARCRNWKIAYAALLLLTLIALSCHWARKYQEFAGERRQLEGSRTALNQLLRQQRRIFNKLSEEAELLQKLREAKIGSTSVAAVLTRLSGKLPSGMWVTDYSQADQMIDLTVSSPEDVPDLYRIIGENDSYSIVNLRKNRGYNDRIIFNVKLKGNDRNGQ